jgi:murein DD-endopeptidase MepM/ murein hydrolase activator NlpD
MPVAHTCFDALARRRATRRLASTCALALVALLATGLRSPAASGSPVPNGAPVPAGTSVPEVDAEVAPAVPLAIAMQSANSEAAKVESRIRKERAGIACPVDGTIRFYDDFGNARSGGRLHEGNDLMSAGGVPVVAVVDGAVAFKSGNRQGKGAYLRGADGNEYWYFHLNSYVGEPRVVRQGDVIGIVGESGNAGGVHTHFEIHPGWDPYEVVNPYPKLDLICTDRVPMR